MVPNCFKCNSWIHCEQSKLCWYIWFLSRMKANKWFSIVRAKRELQNMYLKVPYLQIEQRKIDENILWTWAEWRLQIILLSSIAILVELALWRGSTFQGIGELVYIWLFFARCLMKLFLPWNLRLFLVFWRNYTAFHSAALVGHFLFLYNRKKIVPY